MDYPQLNMLLGLGLMLTLVISIGLRVLLSRVQPPAWMSSLSWLALLLHLGAALYIEILFLQHMTPAFNQQLGLGILVMGVVGALVTAFFYRRVESPRLAGLLFGLQILMNLIGVFLAFGLYRSLVPMPAG